MKTNIYVIYDVVAGSVQQMFMSVNDALACRNFDYVSKQNPLTPATDLELYCVGSINLENGKVTALDDKQFIRRGE